MRWILFILALLAPPAAMAEALVAARTIRAKEVIGPADIVITRAPMPGALTRSEEAIGLEARATIYQGRPIRPGDLGPPALIERNQIVLLEYSAAGLQIRAEGRALTRAAVGERVRVMNLSSRITVSGTVRALGKVSVP